MFNSFLSNVTTQATKAAQALATEYKQATAVVQAPSPGAPPTTADGSGVAPIAAPATSSSPSPVPPPTSAASPTPPKDPGSAGKKTTRNVAEISREELVVLVQKLQKRLAKVEAAHEASKAKLEEAEGEVEQLRRQQEDRANQIQVHPMSPYSGAQPSPHVDTNGFAATTAVAGADRLGGGDGKCLNCVVQEAAMEELQLKVSRLEQEGESRHVEGDVAQLRAELQQRDNDLRLLQQRLADTEAAPKDHPSNGAAASDPSAADEWQLRFSSAEQQRSGLEAQLQQLAKELQEQARSHHEEAAKAKEEQQRGQEQLQQQLRQRDADMAALLTQHQEKTLRAAQELDDARRAHAKELQAASQAAASSSDAASQELSRQLQQRTQEGEKAAAQWEAARRELETSKAQWEKEQAQLQQRLSGANDDVAQQLKAASDAAENTETELRALTASAAELRREKEASDVRAAQASRESAEWKRKFDEAQRQSMASAEGPALDEQESASWRQQVEERKQRSTDEEAKAQQAEARLLLQRKEAEAKVEQLTRQHAASLSAAQQELKVWQGKHEEASKGSDAFDFVRAKLEREIKGLVDKERELKEQLKAAEAERAPLKAELERVKKERAELQQSSQAQLTAQQRAVEEERRQLEQSRAEQQATLQAAQAQLSQLQKAVAEKEAAWAQQRKASEEKSGALDAQLQALRKAEEAQRVAREEAKVEASKLSEKLGRLQKLLEDSLHKSQVLEQKNTGRKIKVKAMKEELEAKAKERTELEARLAAAEQRAAKLAPVQSQLQTQLESTSKEADSRAREVKDMRQRLEALLSEKELMAAAHTHALSDKDRVIANTRAEWEESRERLRKGEDEKEEMLELRRELASRRDEVLELQNELEHERVVKERERIALEQVQDMEREERERERDEKDRAYAKLDRERKEREEALEAEVKALNVKLRAGMKKFKATVAEAEALKEKADRAEKEAKELSARLQESEVVHLRERTQLSEEALAVEHRHSERYERLLREYRQYKDSHDHNIDDLNGQLREAKEKAAKLEEEIATGQPQERRILELAELQARREDAVRRAETEVATLRQQNAEYKRRLSAVREELSFAQEQLQSHKGSESRSAVNIDYLKSVLVRFLAFEPSHPQRRALIPVLGTILSFTPEELRNVETVKANSGGSWLSMLGMNGVDPSAPGAANPTGGPPRTPSSRRTSAGGATTPRTPGSAANSLPRDSGSAGMNGRLQSAPPQSLPSHPATPTSSSSSRGPS